MKISSISLTNFAQYERVSASFDPNVTYIVGKNGAGKTTIGFTGVQAIMQGIAEKASTNTPFPVYGERFRFIGPNAATAKGVMELYDGKNKITITRKFTKTGTELSFAGPEGMTLNQQWLTDLFNVYLIAPKKFLQLSGKDQAKVLGIDTSEYDNELAELKRKATDINRDIKNMGEIIPVMEVLPVDTAALEARKQAVRGELNNKYKENKAINDAARAAWQLECEKARTAYDLEKSKWQAECDKDKQAVTDFNNLQQQRQITIRNARTGYNEIEVKVDAFEFSGYVDLEPLKAYIDSLPAPEPTKTYVQPEFNITYTAPAEPSYIPELPDNAPLVAIEAEISAAAETNLAAYKYTQYKQRVESRDSLLRDLEANKNAQYKCKNRRTEYLQSFEWPQDGMEISDEGDLLLNGKPLCEPYFSTGELIKIVPEMLAVTNPAFRYVFIQDFNMLDEDAQADVENYLVDRGFQLVVELVGKDAVVDKNCIVLKDGVIVNE